MPPNARKWRDSQRTRRAGQRGGVWRRDGAGVRNWEVGKGEYIELSPDELDAIAIESKRVIDIDEFVPKKESDELYPNKFEDHYEEALKDLLKKKQEGKPIERPERREPTKVVNLMDALRKSVEASGGVAVGRGRRRSAEPLKRKKAKRAS